MTTTTTGAKTSLKNGIRAVSKFIALMNFSEVDKGLYVN